MEEKKDGVERKMHRRWGPRRRSARLQALGGRRDLIGALPDDLLILVLDRLHCAAAVARTGVLSRRWRSLWARLRQIVFRDVPYCSLEAALGRLPSPPPAVCLLDIRIPQRVPEDQRADEASVKSLLCAAALLEPEKFVFEIPSDSGVIHGSLVVNLPCFQRATSIVLNLRYVFLRVPAGAEFAALETLSLSYCTVAIDRLLSCCPRLRKLYLAWVSFVVLISLNLNPSIQLEDPSNGCEISVPQWGLE
uniref:F-box domain-containing protein n=1 Tax=Aegilops tauschii TaxID=37682 RepID=R7WA62_AEGTA